MTYAIKAENVTKSYRLGERKGSKLLSEALSRRKTDEPGASGPRPWFNALEDVSFEIEQGSAVGIIGRNGAGKTTLLKLISRITRPTKGTIHLCGRVGSLLEVGTGFHPELTGRENIFMNGSMLGMRRAEIQRKFDEIVAFADVGRFIDTPVKRYSSGMYVRLAFAVAAHLEPEILVVDEVLAVGDANFQRKCLGKMGEVAQEGRTVLFVSHNMAAIQQLTSRAIILERGRLVAMGGSAETVDKYLTQSEARTPVDMSGAQRWDGRVNREIELLEAEPLASGGIFSAEDKLGFRLRIRANHVVERFQVFVGVYQISGTPVGATWSAELVPPSQGDAVDFCARFDGVRLAPGRYYLAIGTGTGYGQRGHIDYDGVSSVCDFEVTAPAGEGGTLTFWNQNWGPVRIRPLCVESGSSGRRDD